MSCPAHLLQRNERGQNQTERRFTRTRRLPTQHRGPLQLPGFPSTGVERPAAPSRPCPPLHTATPPAAKCSRHNPLPRSRGRAPPRHSPLRQGHKRGERGVKGHLGPWRLLRALHPPRPPACRAQSGSFLRAVRWKHKGKNRNQLLATSANFPLRNLSAQLTICPHRGDSIRRARRAVLPRLEPLCFPTQLPPTSHRAPGGGKCP